MSLMAVRMAASMMETRRTTTSILDKVKGEEKRGLRRSDEQAEPCVSASGSNGLALCIDIILTTSYLLSSSPRLTLSHSRNVLLANVIAAGILIDIVLVTVYSTTSRCLCHSESCANHVTKLAIILTVSYSLSSSPRLTHSHSHHILLTIVLAAGVLITILLILVGLITSCHICQLSFVSDTQSNATDIKTVLLHVMIAAMGVTMGAFARNVKCIVAYIDVHTRDIKNRTGLSHYACNPLRVCECDPSICSHQEKKKLRPERPDALDALDTSHATCLTWTQFAMAQCIRMQLATASAYRMECVRAFSFRAQPCQNKWRLDDTCHGTTVTLAVKAQNITANTRVAFVNTQRVPGIVTQSCFIHSI